MNSFRVTGTRFRILKGGKIGLGLSISLMGGIIVLSSVSVNAQDFFNGVTDGITYTSGDISATAKSDTGTSTANYSATNPPSENIIFKPERVKSSFIGVENFEVSGISPTQSTVFQSRVGTTTGTSQDIADGTYVYTGDDGYGNIGPITATNYDKAYYQTFTPSTDFTVILDSNSTVNNIIKQTSQYYSVNNTTTYDISNNTYKANYDISNDSYKANLVFDGLNTVSGTTSIDDGNIKLNGSVSFGGTVNAGSINVNTTNTITFNSTVDLSAGTTDAMNFSKDGIVLLSDDLAGNVTSGVDGRGTLTVVGNSNGKEQIISGNIGTSTSSDINVLNIGSNTVSSNYSKTVVNGDVFANSTVLNNNGTTNSSTLFLSNASDITSTITTTDANMGILTLAGSSIVTGSVGSTGKLAEVNSGATSSSSTFTSTVNAVNVTNTGSGTTTFKDDVTAATVNINAGTTNFEKNLTATSTNITTGTGNFNTVSGTTNSNIVFSGSGTANLYGNLTGAVTGTGVGTLTTTGTTNQTITGAVGNIGNLNVSNTGSTTVAGAVSAGNTNIANGSNLIMTDGSNITSIVTGAGNLTLAGDSTVTGTVGNLTTSLGIITAGASGKTVIFTDDVYATTTNIGAGTVDIKGNLTGAVTGTGILTTTGTTNQTIIGAVNIGNLNVSNTGSTTVDGNVNAVNTKIDSNLIMTDGSNITSIVTGAGNLTLAGDSTVTGTVGASGIGNSLGTINAGASGKTVTFKNDVYATNTNIGAGTVDLKGDLTGAVTGTGVGTLTTTGTTNQTITGAVGNIGNLNVSNSGSTTIAGAVSAGNTNIANGSNLIMTDGSNISSTVTGAGNLTLEGTSTVSGTVGNSTTSLGTITAGASGETVTFKNDVYATNTNIGAGTVDFNTVSGNTTSDIVFSDDGIVNLSGDLIGNINFDGNNATINVADGKGILGSVETLASNSSGIINYEGDGKLEGEIKSPGISELNINTQNKQNTPEGVLVTYDAVGRELYADLAVAEISPEV